MDLSLLLVGTSGSAPSARRSLPATLVRRGGDRLLVDCGEGTQRQLLRSVGLLELDEILITHLHVDHWLGLPGLLKTFALRDRTAPLALHGPRGLRAALERMHFVIGRLPYPLKVTELSPGDHLSRDGYRIRALGVEHGTTAALGYALVEDDRPGRFDEAAARALGVTPGPDFGRLQRGEEVGGVRPEQAVGPPRLGRKVVLSGDTKPCDAIRLAAREADVLLHEATFLEEDAERAAQTAHSTARQAAQLAAEAGVRLLVLHHLSTRYPPSLVREEAEAALPGAVVGRDLDLVEVPFPERDEQPTVTPWSVVRERQADARKWVPA